MTMRGLLVAERKHAAIRVDAEAVTRPGGAWFLPGRWANSASTPPPERGASKIAPSAMFEDPYGRKPPSGPTPPAPGPK